MRIFFFLCLIFFSFFSQATVQTNGFHVFVGAGNNFTFPSTYRLGHREWEYGKLSDSIWGAAKKFPVQKNYYTQMGLGLVPVGHVTVGLSAALGAEYDLFWGLGFRAEVMGVVGGTGFAGEQGNIGISYDL